MIEYRKATVDNIDELVKVRLDFLLQVNSISTEEDKKALIEPTGEFLRAGLSDGSFIQWLATDGGKIIGTSSVSFYLLPPILRRLNGKSAYIANISTYPAYRKQGVGTKLLTLAIDEAKSAGCADIHLHATDMGRPLYEKHGFRPKDNAMGYYDDRR